MKGLDGGHAPHSCEFQAQPGVSGLPVGAALSALPAVGFWAGESIL